MSFIDSTYLVGEINIPNINQNATSINQAIDQYEEEILISALGYKLYSLLIADLDNSGKPQTQIYTDLVNGAEFEHTFMGLTQTLKWKGLINESKQSFIAYYVYYKYIERENNHLSGVGSILIDSDQGKRISPINKMCAAWDRMLTLYGKIPAENLKMFGYNSSSFLREYTGFNSMFIFNNNPSLYNFLFANMDSYPDWIFNPIGNINMFGI
jgi:hypothetical protein